MPVALKMWGNSIEVWLEFDPQACTRRRAVGPSQKPELAGAKGDAQRKRGDC